MPTLLAHRDDELSTGGVGRGLVSLGPRVSVLLKSGWGGKAKRRMSGWLSRHLTGRCSVDPLTVLVFSRDSDRAAGTNLPLPAERGSLLGRVSLFCPCLRENELPFPLISLHTVDQSLVFEEICHFHWFPLLR